MCQKEENVMESLVNLESVYEHLEESATSYKYPHNIGTLFMKLRNLFQEQKYLAKAKIAQWEIDFFNFHLEKGKVLPTWETTDEKGKLYSYPGFKNFNHNTYDYLIQRLNSTNNPLMKARYAHILWCSPRKHTKYAKAAVDSYLSLVKIYEEKDKEAPKGHFGLDCLRAMQNAYSITNQIGYNIDKIKSELKRLVKYFNFNSGSSFALRGNLIELMLKGKKKFSKEDFAGFQDICWQVATSLNKQNNIHGSIDMLNIGEKIDEKVGIKTHSWILKRAESYETLMNRRKKGDLAIPDFCLFALENYKKLGDKAKIAELEKKYSEFKSSVKLEEIGGEIDLTKTIQTYNKFAHKIVKRNSEEIIRFLMLNKNLLPTYKAVKKIISEQNKKFVFQQFAAVSVIDQRCHTAQHFSVEEKEYHSILQEYQLQLELNKIHLINAVFYEAILQNKLCTKAFLRFLKKYSWFGKNLYRPLPSGKKIGYNWLNLIAPALNEYFVQMHYYFFNPVNQPNFVLSIDSLTLKIEGLLRDMCELQGVPTSYTTKDSKGHIIRREKDIHALLYEEKIKQLFDEDDLLLFRFLLVEKAGYNLRHRVAHALMLFAEYRLDYMHLLILAFLRLGKYDLVEEKEKIIGNRRQNVFHRKDCRCVKKLHSKNKLEFPNREAANKNGYKPCRVCNP
jgi:hypothetical protein